MRKALRFLTQVTSLHQPQKMSSKSFFTAALAFFMLASGAAASVRAQQGSAPPKSPAAAEQGSQQTPAIAAQAPVMSAAHKYFTDVELINQNGEKMRLYSDLLHDKVVIINSFFATCTGSCLPLTRNLQKVQQALGDRVGKEVHIISISVDPLVDTPASLKEYAKKLNSQPGWYFLTGNKADVDFALKKIGQYVDDKQSHLNIFIIGNERTGLWKKAFGLAKPEELIKVVESVVNDKPATKS